MPTTIFRKLSRDFQPFFCAEALAAGEVQCPNCETRFALDLSDDTVDADEDAE